MYGKAQTPQHYYSKEWHEVCMHVPFILPVMKRHPSYMYIQDILGIHDRHRNNTGLRQTLHKGMQTKCDTYTHIHW